MAGRYAHAKQFKRNERMVRFLRTRVGRLIRNIERKIGDDPALREAFAARLSRAERVRRQSASAAGSSIPCTLHKGYRGYNHPNRFRVWITGQVRRVTTTIRREMRRGRAGDRPPQGRPPEAAELSQSHDRANVILAATGYNFRLSSAASRPSCVPWSRHSAKPPPRPSTPETPGPSRTTRP